MSAETSKLNPHEPVPRARYWQCHKCLHSNFIKLDEDRIWVEEQELACEGPWCPDAHCRCRYCKNLDKECDAMSYCDGSSLTLNERLGVWGA